MNSITAAPAGQAWKTGWTAENPLAIPFIYVKPQEGWGPGPYPGTSLRDLGIAGVTGGRMAGTHLRVDGDGTRVQPGWICRDYDFQFIYVWKGSVKIRTDAGDDLVLSAGAAVTQPGGVRYQLYGFSDDFEAFELTTPAEAAELATPAGRRGQYLEDTRGAYVLGNGPRRFFEYRDLQTTGPSAGRLHIHVVRATDIPCPEGGTGWHTHTMSQWFLILAGRGHIQVEGLPETAAIGPGDAMCLQAGQGHNVSWFNERYTVLELCVPSEYATEPCPPPPPFA